MGPPKSGYRDMRSQRKHETKRDPLEKGGLIKRGS